MSGYNEPEERGSLAQLKDSTFFKTINSYPPYLINDENYKRLKTNEKKFLSYFSSLLYNYSRKKRAEHLRKEDITPEFQEKMLSKKGEKAYLGIVFSFPKLIDIKVFKTYLARERIAWWEFEQSNFLDFSYEIQKMLLKRKGQLIYTARRNYERNLFSGKSLTLPAKYWGWAIKSKPQVYGNAPRDIRQQFAVIAVKGAASNLRFVPQQTKSLCYIAINKSGTALTHVDKEFKTQELCNLAVSKAITALKFVPTEFQSSTMMLKAMMKNRNSINYASGYKKKRKDAI